MDLARQRIHILGVGSIGRLFAHSLAKTAPPDAPPIVLLRQNPSPEVSYSESIILTRGSEKDEQAGFENEHVNDVLDPELPIRNLIVATKAAYTVKAIRSIRRRLDSQSTILFAQNGMGITLLSNFKPLSQMLNRRRYHRRSIQCIIPQDAHPANLPE